MSGASDRGEKFRQYQQIASLKEYTLVSQHAPRVELLVREDGGTWRLYQAGGRVGEQDYIADVGSDAGEYAMQGKFSLNRHLAVTRMTRGVSRR